MLLIVCVDDNMGMAFNHRRQSQDRLLRRRLLERVGVSKLWMSPYTARQFDALPENVRVSETFLIRSRSGGVLLCGTELSRRRGGGCALPLEPQLSGGCTLYTCFERIPSDGANGLRRIFPSKDHRGDIY